MRTRLSGGVLVRAVVPAMALAIVALAARDLCAQTPFVPYFGKNQVHYDNFEWYIYTTDHFEIYYYKEVEPHVERVASYAESAYQQISADLQHDLGRVPVPLIIFKTHSEFQQQNVIPGAAQEGVAAFAEPYRDRMLLPLDEPPDRLYGLIVHELTHIFEFDIIPQSLIRRSVPLWVNEGLSDYERGLWDPLDLMSVRDAAVADIVPEMSNLEGYTGNNARLIYNLGHAVFEFIEARWGKEGIRQFLFALRKSVIGGGADAYEEALSLKADEFDQQFDKYLKDRFKPFRDKERPVDYGRNLAPDPEDGHFVNVFSVEQSPSGDLLAAAVGNTKDGELDIILMSAQDGTIVRDLTPGFDQDMGFEYISTPTQWTAVPWMSWGPGGDRIAYFVRTEKSKSLILQNVVTRHVEQRIELDTVDEPESPSIAPDGRTVAFSGLRNAVGDIFTIDLATNEVTNVTNDEFGDSAPVFAPDGQSLVYLARVSGNQKLFRVNLGTGEKTQLTFGTHDEAAAKFLDDHTLVFPSTAVDPAQPIEPEVARNGNIFNVWTLDLSTGELRQYTDALGGNMSPAPLPAADGKPQVAFVSYYKGDYGLHVITLDEPLRTAASEDFGSPGPIIDFQAPLAHTFIEDNRRRKGAFEKMFLDGMPPVNVGVTSGGDLFGGTALQFSDVLGDRQFSMYVSSISQYRTLAFSYANLSRRFQYALQGYSQTVFYYGNLSGYLYDPVLSTFLSRDQAQATRTARGGSFFGIYPLNRYTRLQFSAGLVHYAERYNDPDLQVVSDQYQQDQFGRTLFRNGLFVPLGVELVQETTVFREFGPLAGSTMSLGYSVAPKLGNSLSRQTLDLDARRYFRIGTSGLLALRARGFRSWGDAPDFLFFGGNSEMRGYDYLQFIGQNVLFGNAELRFPFIEAMLTPLGVFGGIRGVMFFNVGAGWFDDQGFQFATSSPEVYQRPASYDPFGNLLPAGEPKPIDGFRLRDGRASYGLGLETFALGFPVHFDWSWRTLFNRQWEDALFELQGGSDWFRKARFSVWMGYDF